MSIGDVVIMMTHKGFIRFLSICKSWLIIVVGLHVLKMMRSRLLIAVRIRASFVMRWM